jgi:hypothetical protein
MPFEEGIIEVRVAVTGYPLVNETPLLEALIVNAIEVSTGVDGGVGVVPPAPSEDLEQEIKEPTKIGRKAIIFFIYIDYLLMIIPSV